MGEVNNLCALLSAGCPVAVMHDDITSADVRVKLHGQHWSQLKQCGLRCCCCGVPWSFDSAF